MLKNPACSRSVAFRFRGFGAKGGLRGEFGGRRGFGGREDSEAGEEPK